MLLQLPWHPCRREEKGEKIEERMALDGFWHVALELAKGRCQVDGGGTVSLVIDIFEGLFSYAFPF